MVRVFANINWIYVIKISLLNFLNTKYLFNINEEDNPKKEANKFEIEISDIFIISTPINKNKKCMNVDTTPLIINLIFWLISRGFSIKKDFILNFESI
tara:strand:+ start:109 stop:402 length:294 start_codon:yes stop_codon:yes gene_type:complete